MSLEQAWLEEERKVLEDVLIFFYYFFSEGCDLVGILCLVEKGNKNVKKIMGRMRRRI